MNMILVKPEDVVDSRRVRLTGRIPMHVHHVLRSRAGDVLRAGLVGGAIGTGVVLSVNAEVLELDLTLTEEPPAAVGVTLALAMPRPKCFRRVLQAVTTMGVKRLAVFGSFRVEKSYWETPWLSGPSLDEQVMQGLEQAGDTIPPVITLHHHFKPFVEDELPALALDRRRLAAHPGSTTPCPAAVTGPMCLVVGPEGGFTAYEVELLQQAGFEMVSAGKRILRVEQVVPYLMGRLLPL